MKLINHENGIEFNLKTKQFKTKGFLEWKYNPFRNYRLTEDKYYYKDRFYSLEQMRQFDTNFTSETNNIDGVPVYKFIKGQLVDFQTDELDFDINSPVQILAQHSYDGSVNLIMNDNKNKPRLINSRFSPLGIDKYQIVDRKGVNDTNIYDQGEQFGSDTSLYKTYNGIPKIDFKGVYSSGNLKVGNYHFYFRYLDADGNETDFVGESGLVSIFKGTTINGINGGFRDENSYKSVRFLITNIDPAYQYLNVYYSRSTSDINQNQVVKFFKIEQKFLVNSSNICSIFITGNEEVSEITATEINPKYQIAEKVRTQSECQNMLFFGNVHEQNVDYDILSNQSLKFCAQANTGKSYTPSIFGGYPDSTKNTYYDSSFIYNFTGYQKDELYRLGVVYIMNDGNLSPVFNIRGTLNNTISYKFKNNKDNYNNINAYIKGEVIEFNEDTGLIDSKATYDNAFGVSKFTCDNEFEKIIGIDISIDTCSVKKFKQVLQQCNVKGFFFVRQKRMPLRLCQAYIIGVDKESKCPVIPIEYNKEKKFLAERFIDNNRILTHNFNDRKYYFTGSEITYYAAICPEYDINYPYYNTLFSGNDYILQQASTQQFLSEDDRHFILNKPTPSNSTDSYVTKIVGVQDNVKLIEVNNKLFSGRAGEAEEARKFEYLKYSNKKSKCSNIIRGIFGPFLAIDGYNIPGTIVNIYIPDKSTVSNEDLIKMRYNDKSPFYAISERYSLDEFDSYFKDNNIVNPLYRGDSYICYFTHRVNRNFQDPSAPTNDKIVDDKCWANNFKVSDGVINIEKFSKINLGDVNAVKLGMWVTIPVISSTNLNIRSLDDSYPDEMGSFGHARGFYPYTGILPDGSYKTPEALCINKGYSKSLSERYNIEAPDVPAIKNDFTNRISYSDIHVTDAFRNGFRVFQATHYRDYPKTYGQIIKLIELSGNLICVFEHGIAKIPVNERAVAAEGSGGFAYINTSNVLPENPYIISDSIGSQWQDSVIKTESGIYGFDTVAKKIWMTDGNDLYIISDKSVEKFLNNNISLTERELTPIIGIRNVKTHYYKNKGDILFTFYDNLDTFQEKVWNLCFNEKLSKWVTFYSWVPSISENIYNTFFTFDRDTTKQISELWLCKNGKLELSDYKFTKNSENNYNPIYIKLSDDLEKLYGTNFTIELESDPYDNKSLFKLNQVLETKTVIKDGKEVTENIKYKEIDGKKYYYQLKVINKEDKEYKKDFDKQIESKHTIHLNLKLTIGSPSKNYACPISVTTKEQYQNLTTSFYRHGVTGIIDDAEELKPCYWYDKQHPFEFEFIVNDHPDMHKIFDNLEIISNNAEPESFHYEVIGDCYDFANDKQNMYIRQEATKNLYQLNGSNISFDSYYTKLKSEHRLLEDKVNYEKSTLLPLYYSRQDTINTIEDYYHQKKEDSKDFSALSGGEVLRNSITGEYSLWEHSKAVDISKNKQGRLRGNMHYKEDKWYVQINPFTIVQKNESQWKNSNNENTDKVPVELYQSPVPDDVITDAQEIVVPKDFEKSDNNKGRGYVTWNWEETQMQEAKVKDKWVRIRIRYSGEKLAVITAIKTLYSISYA